MHVCNKLLAIMIKTSNQIHKNIYCNDIFGNTNEFIQEYFTVILARYDSAWRGNWWSELFHGLCYKCEVVQEAIDTDS